MPRIKYTPMVPKPMEMAAQQPTVHGLAGGVPSANPKNQGSSSTEPSRSALATNLSSILADKKTAPACKEQETK